MHLSFLTSHNLLFFRSCKTSKKTTFSVFLSFFLVKLSKSQSLKLNISITAWPILMILVSICRILNGLSDEINLFWRCSSPLRKSSNTGNFWILGMASYHGERRVILSLRSSLMPQTHAGVAFLPCPGHPRKQETIGPQMT